MNEKHQKKNHTCLSVRRPFICFFLALGVFLLSAFPTELYAQKKTITLDYKELGLMELFKKIEEKSDYVFFYYDVLIDKDVKVPARFKNMTVEQILDKVFANMELAYSINKKQITIKKKVLQEKTKKEGFFVKFGGNLFFISPVFFFLNPIKSCRYVCFLVTLKTPHH